MRKPKKAPSYHIMPLEAKLWLCEQKEADPSLTRAQLCTMMTSRYRLLQKPALTTITRVLQRHSDFSRLAKQDHNMKLKHESKPRLKAFDQALAKWVAGREASGVCVTEALIRHKGGQLLTPYGDQALALGGGWMYFFKRRHHSSFNVHGESNDVDDEAAEEALPDLLLATARFQLRDIYNLDESGVCYSMPPTKTIARSTIKGRKKAKERITVVPVVNADGSDKRELFFIGTAAKPHVFQKKSPTTEGYAYANTKKAYMTRPAFQKWLLEFNADMREQSRHVLLLIDNAPSHKLDWEQLKSALGNVTVRFLLKNTTARLQPLDAGIIASLKRIYRQRHIALACRLDELGCSDPYTQNLRQAMAMIKAAWGDVRQSTIVNCWRHCNILYHHAQNLPPEIDITVRLGLLQINEAQTPITL